MDDHWLFVFWDVSHHIDLGDSFLLDAVAFVVSLFNGRTKI